MEGAALGSEGSHPAWRTQAEPELDVEQSVGILQAEQTDEAGRGRQGRAWNGGTAWNGEIYLMHEQRLKGSKLHGVCWNVV